MSVWGKVLGGVAGFAVGGPVGALVGAALGHAADDGMVSNMAGRLGNALPLDPARLAAMLGRRDQLFAINVTVLAAKLAKCDGTVSRAEIDAFKTSFRIPEQSVAEIGRLFDQARRSAAGYEPYADQLGEAFADERGTLEQVLAGLHQIARADGTMNQAETDFLARVASGFRLDLDSAQRAGRGGAGFGSGGGGGAGGGGQASAARGKDDPYGVLRLDRRASNEAIKKRWKQLVRENHPDALSAAGRSAHDVAKASDTVARINAAYDRIKRERGM